jgi:pyruvate dehydrogenase E1 component alpha subunit
MPYERVDGMDALAVREAMLRAAERARKGDGPTLIESVTYRFRGHSLADPAYYRTRDEENHWRSTRDPIALFEAKLKEHDLISDEEINATNERADAAVEEAAQFAEESPNPDPDELYDDVVSDGTGAIAWRHKPSTPRD